MTIKKSAAIAMASLCLASPSVVAGNWSGDAEAGYLQTSGNVENRTLNGKINLENAYGKWVHNYGVAAINTVASSETTAERYTAYAKTAYNFTEHDYVYAGVDGANDHFAGIREDVSGTVGYGRRLLKSDIQELDVEIGAGYREQTTQRPESETTGEAVGKFGLDYEWKISENATFLQDIDVLSGSSNTSTKSVSALKLAIIGNLAAKIGLTLEHNSEVPDGAENLDTYTSVTLAYDFGK